MLDGMLRPTTGVPVVVHSTTLLDAAGPVVDGWLTASDGFITGRGIGDGWRRHRTDHTVVDGSDRMLLPGLVDLHVHGGGGHSHEGGPKPSSPRRPRTGGMAPPAR